MDFLRLGMEFLYTSGLFGDVQEDPQHHSEKGIYTPLLILMSGQQAKASERIDDIASSLFYSSDDFVGMIENHQHGGRSQRYGAVFVVVQPIEHHLSFRSCALLFSP